MPGADAVGAGDGKSWRGPSGVRFHDGVTDESRINSPPRRCCISLELVSQFGGTYYAPASYNAGDSRVQVEVGAPALDEDEFIDDIRSRKRRIT
jgi:hypothetical protein